MKPPVFDYHAPRTVDEALALLAEYGDEAKVLAGGQSLVPAMNFRLARPAILVDLNNVQGLTDIAIGPGGLRLGAMTRQRVLEHDPRIAAAVPLLHGAMPHVAHPQIRNRGTLGGSLAHADPAAELPAVLVALGGQLTIRGATSGQRTIDADAFFTGLFETAVAVDEMLTEVHWPRTTQDSGWGFHEMSRRHGDYALVGVAAHVTVDARGYCASARIVLLSVGDGPVTATRAGDLLVGQAPTAEAVRAAAEACARHDIDPVSDLHASRDYRIHLAEVLTRRALSDAFGRASGSFPGEST